MRGHDRHQADEADPEHDPEEAAESAARCIRDRFAIDHAMILRDSADQFAGTTVHEIILRARNLTDEAAYNHVSFIKFQAPLPGRDISLIYRLLF